MDSQMPHTYSSLLFHCVFSTKDRRPAISPALQPRLWAYIGGIAREHGMNALAVGGTDDHIHLLLSLPATLELAKAMRQIKAGSSRWMHESALQPGFAWQEGYGAFSIGKSHLPATVAYINGQQEHHKKRDFRAEFLAILKKHGIAYDERYVFG
jgi:putative transposase